VTLVWGQEMPFSNSSSEEEKETLSSSSFLNQALPIIEKPKISEEIWETLRPVPTPRSEVVAVNLEDKIYVIGGFDQNSKPTNVVEVFDSKNNSWGVVNPLPKKTSSCGCSFRW